MSLAVAGTAHLFLVNIIPIGSKEARVERGETIEASDEYATEREANVSLVYI